MLLHFFFHHDVLDFSFFHNDCKYKTNNIEKKTCLTVYFVLMLFNKSLLRKLFSIYLFFRQQIVNDFIWGDNSTTWDNSFIIKNGIKLLCGKYIIFLCTILKEISNIILDQK